MKNYAQPEFYDDQFVIGIIKSKLSFKKWTYIVADDGYLDSYYFPDIFGEKEDLEPLLIALIQLQANLANKRVMLMPFLQQSLSSEILNNYPLVKGKYVYPGEIRDPNLTIELIERDSQGGGKEQQ